MVQGLGNLLRKDCGMIPRRHVPIYTQSFDLDLLQRQYRVDTCNPHVNSSGLIANDDLS